MTDMPSPPPHTTDIGSHTSRADYPGPDVRRRGIADSINTGHPQPATTEGLRFPAPAVPEGFDGHSTGPATRAGGDSGRHAVDQPPTVPAHVAYDGGMGHLGAQPKQELAIPVDDLPPVPGRFSSIDLAPQVEHRTGDARTDTKADLDARVAGARGPEAAGIIIPPMPDYPPPLVPRGDTAEPPQDNREISRSAYHMANARTDFRHVWGSLDNIKAALVAFRDNIRDGSREVVRAFRDTPHASEHMANAVINFVEARRTLQRIAGSPDYYAHISRSGVSEVGRAGLRFAEEKGLSIKENGRERFSRWGDNISHWADRAGEIAHDLNERLHPTRTEVRNLRAEVASLEWQLADTQDDLGKMGQQLQDDLGRLSNDATNNRRRTNGLLQNFADGTSETFAEIGEVFDNHKRIIEAQKATIQELQAMVASQGNAIQNLRNRVNKSQIEQEPPFGGQA